MTKIEENSRQAMLKKDRHLRRSIATLRDNSGADTKAEAIESVSPTVTEEANGSERLDPTRYGDWERNGRCIDF